MGVSTLTYAFLMDNICASFWLIMLITLLDTKCRSSFVNPTKKAEAMVVIMARAEIRRKRNKHSSKTELRKSIKRIKSETL